MFFLCRKELYIVKEPLTKNRTCQTWRERQVCACRVREPLDEMIAQMPPSQQERYYVSGYPEDENPLEPESSSQWQPVADSWQIQSECIRIGEATGSRQRIL